MSHALSVLRERRIGVAVCLEEDEREVEDKKEERRTREGAKDDDRSVRKR